MLNRRLLPVLRDRLRAVPAVVLGGPPQVGKTTLARAVERAYRGRVLYLDLQRDTHRATPTPT